MKIALLGDTALFGKYSINNKGVFNYLTEIKEKLQEFDVIIANLETPFNVGSKPSGYKSAYISSQPENIKLLKYLGITLVNLANNHVFDYGIDAYNLTKQILFENSIDYFGVEGKESFIEKNGNKIACAGFCCYSTNPLGLSKQGINELEYQVVEYLLKKNKKSCYNTILSIHAGQEHINYPNYDHIKFARKLSEISSFVYYGHHPHVLQGIENYNDSLIAYSLGNFFFDDVYTNKSLRPLVKQNENNKSSIILELEFKNNKLIKHNIIPIYAGKEKMELGNDNILKSIEEYSSKLKLDETTYKIMRNEIFTKIKQQQTTQRDLKWLQKRLNLRTLVIIKDLLMNKLHYNSNFKKHIKN